MHKSDMTEKSLSSNMSLKEVVQMGRIDLIKQQQGVFRASHLQQSAKYDGDQNNLYSSTNSQLTKTMLLDRMLKYEVFGSSISRLSAQQQLKTSTFKSELHNRSSGQNMDRAKSTSTIN